MATARVLLPAVLAFAAVLVAGVAEGQQFGQWSWDAMVGVEDRTNENLVGDETVSKYATRSYYLGLGVNGYVLHPAVARFNLRLDTWFTEFPGSAAQDNVRIGGRFNLGLFERGAFPTRLYFGRSQYKYPDLVADDPNTLLGGLPESTTSWGGRFRLRRGFLRGLLLGADSTELKFQGTDRRTETVDRYFADWSRSGKKIQHHLRLVHEARDYARIDYAFDTTTLTWDEHGRLAPTWRWDLFAVGIRRATNLDGVSLDASDTASLRNKLIHDFSDGSFLDLSYGFGYASSRGFGSAMDHSIEGRYRRMVGSGWEFSPFAAFTWQEVGDGTTAVARGGLSVNWNWRSGSWDSSLSGQGSYGQSMYSISGRSETQPFWAGAFAATMGHGSPARLRKEVEVSLSRNEIESVGRGNSDLPDLGISFAAAGRQDVGRARISLFRDWSTGNVSTWAEWRIREAESLVDDTRLSAEDVLATASLRWKQMSVTVNAGSSVIDDFRASGQEITYVGGSVVWNPWRFLRTSASYREDFRRLALAPDVDSDRIQASVEFHLGRLFLLGEVFQYTERPEVGFERQNRGIFVSVRRGFAGWLPFVTGPQRRGVIR